MASCARKDRARRNIAVVLLAGSMAPLGCRTAARTFFDLPERPVHETGAVRVAGATAQPGPAVEPPPIEGVTDRDSVLAALPKAPAGHIDWATALAEGVIRPRSSLPGRADDPPLTGFGFDFYLKGPSPPFDAYFPHSTHVQWLACQSCHPRIFTYRGTEMTMNAINSGEACGRCHGRVAFPVSACGRCHPRLGLKEGSLTADLGEDTRLPRLAASDGQGAAGPAFPRARFAHWTHRIRYRCSACHPALFEARIGADTLRMADIQAGEACGACHNGQAAFGIIQCDRCHAPIDAGADPAR